MSWRGRWLGLVAVLSSAAAFALSTAFVKVLARAGVPVALVAWGRFAIGALLLTGWYLGRRRLPRPIRWDLVLARAFTNVAAVWLFYAAIALTTVTKANALNMTYPLFVAILAPRVLGERTRRVQWLAILVGLAAIWLIIAPRWDRVVVGDLVGLACGVVAAVAILFLRRARAYDRPDTIVFVLMWVGTLLLLPAVRHLDTLSAGRWGWWLAAALSGIGGQLLITFGYRYVTAVDGAMASTARILFATLLGVLWFGDPLSPRLVAGLVLLAGAIYAVGRLAAAPIVTPRTS